MDRRGKKLEKKRKQREQKKKATAIAAQNLTSAGALARTAAREPFGPCYVSFGWDDLVEPALVTVIVTRKLPHGRFVAGIALVDRTCLGVKNGFLKLQASARDLADFIEEVGRPHGGMIPCEPPVAQSIVYHALDYARSLGFEPHPDFPALLYGPRPAELVNTPWSAPERPTYIAGPDDDVPVIANRLTKALGAGRVELVDAFDDQYDGVSDAEDDVIHSPLGRTV
jgi:hypothetical protein